MISNSTFKAPEKNSTFICKAHYSMEFLLHRRRAVLKRKKLPPHVGIRFFKLPHHFFFFFFSISIEYHKKKVNLKKKKIFQGALHGIKP
jgi:hypothetical protein